METSAEDRPTASGGSLLGDSPDTRQPAWVWLAGIYLFAVAIHFLPSLLFPAQIAIYNDEITYKVISRDLWETSHIQREYLYRTNVPPLYPLLLAPFHALGDPMLIHRAQTLATMAVYFLTIFPTFWIARRLLPVRESLVAAGLLVLSPQTVYNAWLMSGNLFLPLFAFFLWFLLRMGDRDSGQWPVALAGWCLAGCILTRLSGLQAFAILLIMGLVRAIMTAGLRSRLRVLGRHLRACGVAVLVVLPFWLWLGYFGPRGLYLTYQPEPPDPMSTGALAGLYLYWTGINAIAWVMGLGVIPAVLAIIACCRRAESRAFSDIRWLFGLSALVLFIGTAHVCVGLVRVYPDWWHPITRYLFYLAPLLWPLAVAGWARMGRLLPVSMGWRVALFAVLALFVGTQWLLNPRFEHADHWFGDSPDLQYYQVRPEEEPKEPITADTVPVYATFDGTEAVLFTAVVFLLFAGLLLKYPRGALAVLAVMLLTLKWQTYTQHQAVLDRHEILYGGVRDIAVAMERQDVPELPLVVQDFDVMQRPFGNVWFWTDRKDVHREEHRARHYLMLTSEEREGEVLVESGDWRLYREDGGW